MPRISDTIKAILQHTLSPLDNPINASINPISGIVKEKTIARTLCKTLIESSNTHPQLGQVFACIDTSFPQSSQIAKLLLILIPHS